MIAQVDDNTRAAAAERARLVRLCARLSGSADAAEDLAQETLLEAWRNGHKLVDPAGRERWLAAIARHVCARWRRQAGRDWARRVAAPPDLEPADDGDLLAEVEARELAALLEQALATLPAATRQALQARYVDELPHAAIAAQLGVGADAVAMRLTRGRQALRRLLTAELRPPGAPDDGWRETRVWCPECGARRLLTRRAPAGDALAFRCPSCHREVVGSEFRLTNPSFGTLLGGLTQPRGILNRVAGWVHAYYRGALASGEAPCTRCGRPTPLEIGEQTMPAWQPPQPALRVCCRACGEASSTSLSGLVMSLPEAQRFWKRHGRIRALPVRAIEADGQPALLTSYASVVSRAQFDVVSARATLAVLAIHEPAPARAP